MFSREIKQSHYVTPRTIQDAFGAYQRLEPLRERRRFRGYVWSIAYGVVIALVWYGIVLLRAGAA